MVPGVFGEDRENWGIGAWRKPRILSREGVDYFGTSDYFSGRKKNDLNEQNFDGEANWSGVVNFHCMQMSFVLSMHGVTIEMTRHVHHVSLIFVHLLPCEQSLLWSSSKENLLAGYAFTQAFFVEYDI